MNKELIDFTNKKKQRINRFNQKKKELIDATKATVHLHVKKSQVKIIRHQPKGSHLHLHRSLAIGHQLPPPAIASSCGIPSILMNRSLSKVSYQKF